MRDDAGPAAIPADPITQALAILSDIREALDATRAEALDAAGAATLCGVSRSKWYGMDTRGLVPASVTIGEVPRWLRAELLAWLRAGAPVRARWQLMRHAEMRRAG